MALNQLNNPPNGDSTKTSLLTGHLHSTMFANITRALDIVNALFFCQYPTLHYPPPHALFFCRSPVLHFLSQGLIPIGPIGPRPRGPKVSSLFSLSLVMWCFLCKYYVLRGLLFGVSTATPPPSAWLSDSLSLATFKSRLKITLLTVLLTVTGSATSSKPSDQATLSVLVESLRYTFVVLHCIVY